MDFFHSMAWIAITFLFFTALVAVISGWKTRGDNLDSAEGYFLAGRGLPGIVIAGSLLLTNLSAEQMVGLNGQGWASDMSPIGWEIGALAELCHSAGRILKVIVEACLLTESEKVRACALVTEAGADYIKTSTGFSTGGATRADVRLFKEHIGAGVKIKAAGGIRTMQDAEAFLRLGCDRLGASSIVKMVKEAERAGLKL